MPIYPTALHIQIIITSHIPHMAEFYQYQKRRRDFGKPCNFSDTEPKSTGHYPSVQVENPKEVKYVLRNPNFIELDNITELSQHFVNTLRVSTGEKGMNHKEGGDIISEM
jgi:dynein intermediate chain 2